MNLSLQTTMIGAWRPTFEVYAKTTQDQLSRQDWKNIEDFRLPTTLNITTAECSALGVSSESMKCFGELIEASMLSMRAVRRIGENANQKILRSAIDKIPDILDHLETAHQAELAVIRSRQSQVQAMIEAVNRVDDKESAKEAKTAHRPQ